jgi:hypothetical protein
LPLVPLMAVDPHFDGIRKVGGSRTGNAGK